MLKVATPATALADVVPLSVPLPGLVPIAIVTDAVLVVRFPAASRICTVTAGEIVVAVVVLLGCCKKASVFAAPATSVNVPQLVEPPVIVKTEVPDLVILPEANGVAALGLT